MTTGKPIKNVIFSSSAREDLEFWERENPKILQKINSLINSILDDPESGIGKPEKLKYELSGLWSRRINHKDRLIYEIRDDTVYILELREHY